MSPSTLPREWCQAVQFVGAKLRFALLFIGLGGACSEGTGAGTGAPMSGSGGHLAPGTGGASGTGGGSAGSAGITGSGGIGGATADGGTATGGSDGGGGGRMGGVCRSDGVGGGANGTASTGGMSGAGGAIGCDVQIAQEAISALGVTAVGEPRVSSDDVPAMLTDAEWTVKADACRRGNYDLSPVAGTSVCLVTQDTTELCQENPARVVVVMSEGLVRCIFKVLCPGTRIAPGVYSATDPLCRR